MTWKLCLVRSPCMQKTRGTQALMGPAGCNRSCEILESELAGDSKVFNLGSVPDLLQVWMLSHPGAAAQLGHAQGVLLDQSLTEHPPSITSRHFSSFPNISWTSVINPNGASCWQNLTGKKKSETKTNSISRGTCSVPPDTNPSAHPQPGNAEERTSSVFTQTLRTLDTEEM